MRIDVDDYDENRMVIKEAYSGAFLESSEGNRVGFCMRDDTIELHVIPAHSKISQWYRVNMQTLEITKMGVPLTRG